MLGLAEVMNPQPPRWLLRTLIERGQFGVVFGPAGTNKTTLALTLLHAVATGEPFAGLVPARAPGVYIAGEGRRGIGKRLQAIEQETGAVINDGYLYVSNAAAQLLDSGNLSDVIQALSWLPEPPGLIVIDTLARNFGPGSENDSGDMSKFVAAVDQLITQTDAAVVVVHHTGVEIKDRSRGSSVLNAACDFEFRVQREQGDRISFTATKMKDHEEPAQLLFAVRQVELPPAWGDEDGPGTSIVLDHCPGERTAPQQARLSPAQRIARDALIETLGALGRLPPKEVIDNNDTLAIGDHVVAIDEWREVAYLRGVSDSDNQSARQKAFARAIKDLQLKKVVDRYGEYCWLKKATGAPRHDRTLSGVVRDE